MEKIMKTTPTLTLVLTLLTSSCFAGAKTGEIPKQPFSSLKLDQETHLTDTNGVLNPKMLLGLIPSNQVKIYLTDGTVLNGLIKETEINLYREFDLSIFFILFFFSFLGSKLLF